MVWPLLDNFLQEFGNDKSSMHFGRIEHTPSLVFYGIIRRFGFGGLGV